MKRHLRNHRRLLLLIGLVATALAAVTGIITARSEHHRAWQAFEQQLLIETRLLEEHAGLSLSAAEQVLRVIATDALNDDVAAFAADPQFWRRLQQALGNAPQVASFMIADVQGDVLLTTTRFPAPPDLNIADRDHFLALQDGAASHVGAPLVARDSGLDVAPISVRLESAQGEFRGIAVALLDLDYFADFYRDLSPGDGKRIGMALQIGKPLVTFPSLPDPVPPSMVEAIVAYARPDTSRVDAVRSPIRETDVLVSYRQVRGYPVVVGVATDASIFLGTVHTIWLRNGVIFLAFTLGLTITLVILGRAFTLVRATQDELAERNRELTALSLTDSLLGIANRRAFDQAMDREWRRARRKQRPLGLLLVDVDHFKLFNDTYGHTAGDRTLKRLATTVDEVVSRAGDVVARYGGEELVVLLPDTGVDGTLHVADRLHAALAEARIPFPVSPSAPRVTVSIGASVTLPDKDLDPEQFIDAADQAVYAAKEEGRNRTAIRLYPEERKAAIELASS